MGGLQAAMKIFDGRAKGVLAVEDNKKDAAAKLREAAKGIPDIEVVELKTKYPQGAERQLIFAVTGRQNQFFHASGRCRMCSQQL